MEWLMMNPQVHGSFASLGAVVGETYIASNNCADILNEMIQKMTVEDRTLRTLRRAIGFSQVVKKDLLPLLINTKDNRLITDKTIKVLADLTTPVECLLPLEVMSKTEAGRNTIIELNWLLISCKETFLDPRGTRRIIDHIREILYKGDKLDESDCEALNDCIILLRNLLNIPDSMLNTSDGVSGQNQILWNLFAHNFDHVLIEMMTGAKRKEWRIAMAQLVVLLYKDQKVATLQRLLKMWIDSCEMSESSEDNESNTSPPEGNSFSSMVTSDPTSDSSDNSGSDQKPEIRIQKPEIKICAKRKQATKLPKVIWNNYKSSSEDMKMDCSSSKLSSDHGYGTAETQESNSTSSNEDESPRNMKPVHPKKPANMIQKSRYTNGKVHLTLQEKEELRRKKLLRRFRSNMVNMKALLHHTPSEEDISHLLKEFTVDFLLKTFSVLISEMRGHHLRDPTDDRAHFSWIIAYFLKFAVLLELDLHHIIGVVSFDVISFLTYDGANLCEQYEIMSLQQGCDMSTNLRKIHLVTTAVREILYAVNAYKKMKHMSPTDKEYLIQFQREVAESEDIRCLFVALLRQFNPQVHSRQYLRDLIVTNHVLLTFIETSVLPDTTSILQLHMKQFVPVEMMRQYGYLLECYAQNTHYVNDCVFTMMHHVAGDLEHVSALFQPTILKTFSCIWESEAAICDDWSDLIEFVIRKFLNTPTSIPGVLKNKDRVVGSSAQLDGWSKEESDCLYWYYVQSSNLQDPVGNVVELYNETGVTKTRIGIIEQLFKQDAITSCQYNELMEREPLFANINLEKVKLANKMPRDEIDALKEHLIKEEKSGGFITWLQKILLETCYAKTFQSKQRDHIIEPIPHYYTTLKEAVPIFAWTYEQREIMESQGFLLLLHKLGLHLPADLGKIFPRIPSSWEPRELYKAAVRLGPIRKDWVKFEVLTHKFLNVIEEE